MCNRKHANFVYTGLIIINICATYLAGGIGVYAAAAFRKYGRIDLFNLLFVTEPLIRSIALLISGKAGEYFGRKNLYLWSVAAFAFSIGICAVAPNGMVFLIVRSFSGFFWGLFFTNVFAIVNDVFPKEQYAVRIGVMQTVNALIFIVGPIICGVLIEKWNWRISLGAMLPFFVVGLLFVECFMPQNKKREATATSQKNGIQRKRKQFEAIRLRSLLRQEGFAVLIVIISVYTLVYSTGNYIPLYAQTVLKASVTLSATVLVPCNIMGMLFSTLTGMYIAKKGCSKELLMAMSGVALCGSLLYIESALKPSFFIIILSTAILGIGAGIYQVMPFAFVQRYMTKDLMAEGTSFIGFIEGIASVIAGVIYSIVMRNGEAIGLVFSSIFGVCVFVIVLLKFKEPGY
jgi:MFS family permease